MEKRILEAVGCILDVMKDMDCSVKTKVLRAAQEIVKVEKKQKCIGTGIDIDVIGDQVSEMLASSMNNSLKSL